MDTVHPLPSSTLNFEDAVGQLKQYCRDIEVIAQFDAGWKSESNNGNTLHVEFGMIHVRT